MSIHPKACSIDNWRTLGPTGFKLGMEVGHDQDTLIHNDIEVVRSKVKVTINKFVTEKVWSKMKTVRKCVSNNHCKKDNQNEA